MNSVAVFADSALITQMAFPPAVQIVVVSNVTALTEAAPDPEQVEHQRASTGSAQPL